MTIDGAGDQVIKLQGVNSYTFCDADGGDPGEESADEGVDVEEQQVADADVDEATVDSSDEEIVSSEEEAVGGDDSSDSEEDDTAIPGTITTFIGNATAPDGYKMVDSCAPLETDADLEKFIGRIVYIGHESNKARGWFVGRVHSRKLSEVDLKKTPSANFVIKYKSKETGKKLNGTEARKLSAHNYGASQWWMELTKVWPLYLILVRCARVIHVRSYVDLQFLKCRRNWPEIYLSSS